MTNVNQNLGLISSYDLELELNINKVADVLEEELNQQLLGLDGDDIIESVDRPSRELAPEEIDLERDISEGNKNMLEFGRYQSTSKDILQG